MKLRIVEEMPKAVLRRFPFIENELRNLVTKKEDFRQLCIDYQDVVQGMKASRVDTEELNNLKNSLEVEILEKVSRIQAEREQKPE